MTNKTHEQILDTIGDASISQEVYSRRNVLTKSGIGVAALALSGMPLGLAALTQSALAQSSGNATSALTLALKLELLEKAYYTAVTGSTTAMALLTAEESAAISAILAHETAHVTLLSAVVTASAPSGGYDFTAGSGTQTGPYAPLTVKSDLFTVAMLLEDLGVRAYKGQFANLLGDSHLTTAFQIHSVEARHAAQIRRLRAGISNPASNQNAQPYMPTSYSSPAVFTAVYGPGVTTFDTTGNPKVSTGEDNQIEYSSYAPLGVNSNSPQAFDEPLSTTDAMAAAAFFGVS